MKRNDTIVYLDAMTDGFNDSNRTIRANNSVICGDHNIIIGDRNNIVGNNNHIRGGNNHVTGDNNIIHGNRNIFNGSSNKIEGYSNHSSGSLNDMRSTITPVPPTSPPPPVISENSNGPVNRLQRTYENNRTQDFLGNGYSTPPSSSSRSRQNRPPPIVNPSRPTKKPRGKVPIYPDPSEIVNDEEATGENDRTCTVCMVNKPNCIALPCRHFNFCVTCCLEMCRRGVRECPLCSADLVSLGRIFLS